MDTGQLLRDFEDCTLPLQDFRHRQHIELAWAMLGAEELPQALVRFSEGLKRYAGFHGKSGLYHATITWAYLLLIHERMERGGRHQGWEDFVRDNPDLMSWKDSILHEYYDRETLDSDLARRIFLWPARAPDRTECAGVAPGQA